LKVEVLINPWIEVDKKITSEIYTSPEIMENLKVLCDVYGSRFPGTAGDLDSVKYMVDKLKDYGCDDAKYETFKMPGWTRAPAVLEVVSPVKRELEAISLPYCIASDFEGRLVDLGTGPEPIYEKRKKEIEGNIVLVNSANPPYLGRSLHRSEKYNRSILAGAKGFIYMNSNPGFGPVTGGISPLIPGLGISFEDGCYLQRIAKRFGSVTVHIHTKDKNKPVDSFNVIGDINGTGKSKEYALSASHYDGHDISQGAFDPASGTVTILEMARVTATVKSKLKRRLRFVCFGAEEIGLHGSRAYVAAHKEELTDLRFMLNLDSAGGPGKKGVIFHDFPEMEAFIQRVELETASEYPYLQRVSPYSDHWPFFQNMVPCGSGGDPNTSLIVSYGHTKYDTVDKVELVNLRLAAANYSRFMFRVANDDKWNVKRKTRIEVDDFVKKMGFEETVALTKRVKDLVSKWPDLKPETKTWLAQESAW
jgi:hypothetical protein